MIPLEEAIEKRDAALALEILQTDPAQANAPTRLGVPMLMLALYYELPQVAAAIRTHRDTISFFEAASMGELDAVASTIQADPQLVNAYAPDGFTVLGLAIFFRQPAIARLLIEAGADVNLPANNARKVAPIHAACARQDLVTLRLLLERGADPDARQEGGSSPLSEAIRAGNAELEALLRSAGARSG
jgi:ankyrin repeat protein